jgi:hypothetical protein
MVELEAIEPTFDDVLTEKSGANLPPVQISYHSNQNMENNRFKNETGG